MTYQTAYDFSNESQFINLENLNSKFKFSSAKSGIQNAYEADDYSDLDRRYASVESYIKELSQGRLHNLIINGPAGVGKTHAVETFLSQYAKGRYKVVKGHMTPLSLYGNLFFHRDPNSILVLDDIDSVFKKIEGVNLLKAAMDTSSVRRINWESSNALKGVRIPDNFEFPLAISQRLHHGGDRLIVSKFDSNDPSHAMVRQIMEQTFGPALLPVSVLESAEISHAALRMMTVYELERPIGTPRPTNAVAPISTKRWARWRR